MVLPGIGESEIVVSGPPADAAAPKRIVVQKPKDDPGKPVAAEQSDVLQFLNRDTLHGSLLEIDPKAGVRWQSPEAKSPIEFSMAKLSEVKLAQRKAKPSVGKDIFGVVLTNGDELEGTIATLDAEKLELDTWYGGMLTIPRAMIKSVVPRRQSHSTIYEGPTGPEGWSNGSTWKYRDGTFYTRNGGILGRDFKLPNLSDIEFDMAWAGYLQVVINIYTDQPDRYGGNAYMLQMNNNFVYLERMRRNNGSSNLGQTELPNMMERNKAHFGVRVDKDAKTISLLVDGHLAKQWTDRGEFAGGGGGVSFTSQGRGLVKVSKIAISSWDGKFEEPLKPGEKSVEDTLKLANGDKVSGALKEIVSGTAALASTYATLKIPVERIEEIDMAGKNASEAKPKPGDIRAYFAGRGMVTVSVEKWDGKEFIGNSPNFGRVTFKPEAFNRIQFNLGDEAQKGDDFDSGSDEGGGPSIEGMMIRQGGGMRIFN